MPGQENGDDALRQALAEFRNAVQSFASQFEGLQPQPLGQDGFNGDGLSSIRLERSIDHLRRELIIVIRESTDKLGNFVLNTILQKTRPFGGRSLQSAIVTVASWILIIFIITILTPTILHLGERIRGLLFEIGEGTVDESDSNGKDIEGVVSSPGARRSQVGGDKPIKRRDPVTAPRPLRGPRGVSRPVMRSQ